MKIPLPTLFILKSINYRAAVSISAREVSLKFARGALPLFAPLIRLDSSERVSICFVLLVFAGREAMPARQFWNLETCPVLTLSEAIERSDD